MSDRPWYKRYGADFVHGTLGLTLEEKGAYSICLDLIYDRGGPIPDDARWLAGVCGCSVRKWNAIRDTLIGRGKLVLRDGLISNFRAEKEIENALKTSRKLAENGAKGGNKRAENVGDRNNNNDLDEARLNHRARVQKPEARDQTGANAPETRARASVCPEDWGPKPETVATLSAEGHSRSAIDAGVREMIDWSRSGAKRKTDWDATLRNWVRRNGSRSPPGKASPRSTTMQACDNLIEKIRDAKRERSDEDIIDLNARRA